MDLISYFWTELPTWPDTLLKTLMKHLCFWWSSFGSDEFTASIFRVTELVQVDNKMMEWNKICNLYRKSVQIWLVTVLKGRQVHPSKTPYYLVTTCRKKPKNDQHENLKSYYLHLHHYASWWGVIVCVAQWITIRLMVWSSNPSGDVIFCSHLDQPQGPPILLYTGHQVFPWGKAPRVWCWPPNPT